MSTTRSTYQSSAPATESHRAGFTLVEVIYVCIIVGILAAIALPRIDFTRPRVEGAAMELGSHLLLAQRVAVLRQHDVRVIFDPAAGTLLVHEDADNDGKQDSGETVTHKELPEGVAFSVTGTTLMGTEVITFEEGDESLPVLVFHRNGSASEEGAIHVSSPNQGDPADDRAVMVERATGLTQCWSRRTGSWKEGC